MVELNRNERIDDLQCKGLRIIQNPELFCFGTDSVLLSHFIQIKKGDIVADLGAGGGILSILIGGRNRESMVYAVEIQDVLFDLAQRSIAMNGLINISLLKGDLKDAPLLFPRCDVVVCNPPYERVGSGAASPNESHRIARHELKCSFDDVAKAASGLLGDGGRFYCINRAERMTELSETLRRYCLQPKIMRFIHKNTIKPANYVMICANKNGGEGVKIMPPLIMYDSDGKIADEVKKMYEMEK